MQKEKTMEQKVVVVVGASGGIGNVLSRQFHQSGASVVLAARNESKLRELQSQIGEERTLIVPTDATDVTAVKSLFKKAVDTFGRVDAVVITAGTWDRLSSDFQSEKALELIEKHYKAIFLISFIVGFVAQEFFKQQGGGLIANISSHAAVRPELPGNLSYAPMKAASRQFMLALRHELTGTGVRVTDIQPAIVNTEGNRGMLDTEEKRDGAVQPEEIGSWVMSNIDNPNVQAERLFDSKVVL